MKRKYSIGTSVAMIIIIALINYRCKKPVPIPVDLKLALNQPDPALQAFDSTLVAPFFKHYSQLQKYQSQVLEVYRKHTFNYLWHDSKGRKETADVLYSRINSIAAEGVFQEVPYKTEMHTRWTKNSAVDLTNELLLTSLYFYYTDKVLAGIDTKKRQEMGWFLERESTSYVRYLDTLLANPGLVNKETQLNPQYYLLKKALEKYQAIARSGGWDSIAVPEDFKRLKPGDTSDLIVAIRKRLYTSGDIKEDSGNAVFDQSLAQGVAVFQARHGFTADKTIGPKTLGAMNISVADRIKTIVINMERCRWISPTISKEKEYIIINIPAYKLWYIKNDSLALQSDVVVGTAMNQTVIFSGKMKYIVFSPYWNIPESIIKNEVLPAMAKNANYLAQHNMEWNKGRVRQKPGERNSLGLVKFIFPNSNNIYLHDTPSKTLFQRESRAFSHGCIRVARPKELAQAILSDDPKWNAEKIHEAMHSGTEKWYTLNREVPVYIGYFTTWVDRLGNIHFYNDVYQRDGQLANLLIEK